MRATTIGYIWFLAGDHVLEATADSVTGETDTADNSKTATVTVVEKKALFVEVTTDKDTYTLGEWVYITVNVIENSGSPVEGASVHVEVTTASGNRYAGDGTTDRSGLATFRLKTKNPDGKSPPPYKAEAWASKAGYDDLPTLLS